MSDEQLVRDTLRGVYVDDLDLGPITAFNRVVAERDRLVQQLNEAVLLVAQLRQDVQECVADAAGWRKDAESAWLTIDRLRARNGRLRKTVNWLRGALHEETHKHHAACPNQDGCGCSCDWAHRRCKTCPPHEHLTVENCGAWECQRARDILAEDQDA